MRMNWTQLLSSFFLSFFFFPSIFIAKKGATYHFIDDVRVRVCAEAGLKDSFFLRLNF